MSDLWTPSDDLLDDDPIAAAHVANPHAAPGLAAAGILLPDPGTRDDDANAVAAAAVLAKLDGDDGEPEHDPVVLDDDEDIDDSDDDAPVPDDV